MKAAKILPVFPVLYECLLYLIKGVFSMIEKTNLIIFKWLERILAIVVSFLVAILFLQVVLRYVFSYSISQIDELSRYIFIWVIFLGISLGFKSNAHLGVEFLTNALSIGKKRLLKSLVIITLIVFWTIVLISGFQMVGFTVYQKSATLLIPMAYVYLAVPISSIFCLLALVEMFKNNILISRKGR